MKCRLYKQREQGIALVITLVMLAIVTVMAIVFLGVSRRERASVKMGEDIVTANAMAEAAGERAKAEAIARMAAEGSKLYYDLFNSRSFENPSGFTGQSATSLPNPQNVNYLDRNGKLLNNANYLRMLANLQYDPKVPVFVQTNANGAKDFRYFLDFDRNGLVETNGLVPVVDRNGQIEKVNGTNVFANLTGDPEWIGVLEKPDLPHSETNRFIGRMAYLVLPAGKTLDLNYIHNANANSARELLDAGGTANGYTRNQGVGSWEINLAAFFRELSPTNSWRAGSYNYTPGKLATGAAFDDARAVLAARYRFKQPYLQSALFALKWSDPEMFANRPELAFPRNGIDDYGDGPIVPIGQKMFDAKAKSRVDDDNPNSPWPGSSTTNVFTDLQQIFSLSSVGLSNRIQGPLRLKGTDDRYQFYRMIGQLGVDSTPHIKDKLHLNFVNAIGKITNTYIPWTTNFSGNGAKTVLPINFFTNAADLMLKASIDGIIKVASNRNDVLRWGRQPGTYYLIGDTLVSTNFSLTNIQVYNPYKPAAGTNFPTLRQNEYSPAVHRILQVAVNIFDSMANRGTAVDSTRSIYYPTVFRPLFTKTVSSGSTNIIITGWDEVTNVTEVITSTMDMADFARSALRGTNNLTFFGEHLVIGAKKGHPNFNEMALQTTAEVSRKLEVVKTSATAAPTQTNEMFMFSLGQRWGMEGWNSYSNAYKPSISILGEVQTFAALKDGTNLLQTPIQTWSKRMISAITTNNWPGTTNPHNFMLVLSNHYTLLPDSVYDKKGGRFISTNVARFTLGIDPAPHFVLSTTNRVRYLMWDRASRRILDYVSFDDLAVTTDIGAELYRAPSSSTSQFDKAGNNEEIYWDPTPIPGRPELTVGITNQLAAAAGDVETSAGIWRAFRFSAPLRSGQKGDDDKNGAIAVWRKFMGEKLLAGYPPVRPVTELRLQIPFVPSRRIDQLVSWQANDPLVHYMARDIAPSPRASLPKTTPLFNGSTGPANTPLGWNIGFLNTQYQPWGAPVNNQPTALTFSVGVHDAGIRRSDDWEFPIDEKPNQKAHFFANIGELGQVHRGTPWQTIYLKSIYTNTLTRTGIVANFLPGTLPAEWVNWAGTAGTHPIHDWKLLDVFTTAANENATRGLLSVNQTNRAAWSAVLSGVIIPTNTVKKAEAAALGDFQGADPAKSYEATYINPATPQVATIVDSINWSRERQLSIIPNPNLAANPNAPWIFEIQKNPITGRTNNVFSHVGGVLSAPYLTVQSPFLNGSSEQVKSVLTDRAMEYIPQQIMSLLQRDEPRFVVYAFGQSLKPAPASLTSDPNYFHMCTNYQITGEVTTKTVFRVEGEIPVTGNPLTQDKPLRAVVESYEVLPPVD